MQNHTSSADPVYFATYLVYKDSYKIFGHSAIGISVKNPDDSYDLLFRVGLFASHQVMMEDFIVDKVGREFYAKQIEINQDQMLNLLTQINQDRSLKYAPARKSENKKAPLASQSFPGGKFYHKIFHNCKDYVLDLLRRSNIVYRSFSNKGISIPTLSGKLEKVCLCEGKEGVVKIVSKHTKAFTLIKLNQYIKDKDNCKKRPHSFFAPLLGFDQATKLSAATKLKAILEKPSHPQGFTEKEFLALKSGRLGKIYKAAKKNKFLDLKVEMKEKSILYRSAIQDIREKDTNITPKNSMR